MKNIELIRAIRVAYEKTRYRNILIKVLFHSETKYKISIWFLLVVFIVFLVLKESLGMLSGGIAQIINVILIFSAISLLLIIDISVKKIYSIQYEEYSETIEAYSKNRKFLRYLLFKDELPECLQGNQELIEKLSTILAKENELETLPIFSQHPFTIIIIGFITAIISGGAGQAGVWENEIIFVILIFLMSLLFINFYIIEIFTSKSYRQKELEQFLMWLSFDESTT